MVDVGAKAVTHRIAEAEARVRLPAAVARALRAAGHRTKKGPVFDTAIIAGVMAAKRTSELIPFCHRSPWSTASSASNSRPQARAGGVAIVVRCRVEVHHKTGVEMEALTGATVAALTIYDMCKALSHDIRIERVRLLPRAVARVGGTLPETGIAMNAPNSLWTGADGRTQHAHASATRRDWSTPASRSSTRAMDLLAPLVARAFVSVRAEQRDDPQRAAYETIADLRDDLGPMGGIHAALHAHPRPRLAGAGLRPAVPRRAQRCST